MACSQKFDIRLTLKRYYISLNLQSHLRYACQVCGQNILILFVNKNVTKTQVIANIDLLIKRNDLNTTKKTQN